MRKKSSRKRANGAKKGVSLDASVPSDGTSVDRAAEARRERSSVTGRSSKQQSVRGASLSGPGFVVTEKNRRRNRRSTRRSLSSQSSDTPKPTEHAAADLLHGIADTKQSGTTSTVSWTSSEAPPTGTSPFDGAVAETDGSLYPEGLEGPSTRRTVGSRIICPSKTLMQEDATSMLPKNRDLMETVQPPLSLQPWTSSASSSHAELASVSAAFDGNVNEEPMQ
ncbi:hypothetical protein MTO96_045134, partial [Rhipicephalus appendiculatus]